MKSPRQQTLKIRRCGNRQAYCEVLGPLLLSRGTDCRLPRAALNYYPAAHAADAEAVAGSTPTTASSETRWHGAAPSVIRRRQVQSPQDYPLQRNIFKKLCYAEYQGFSISVR
jgi:hypothetical protein